MREVTIPDDIPVDPGILAGPELPEEQPEASSEVLSAPGHIPLSMREVERIGRQIEDDFRGARADHGNRIEKFKRYIRRWRNLVSPAKAGEEIQFDVPVTQWQVYGKWAEEVAAVFGDDARVMAEPVGASDQRIVEKISCFMTWRIFRSLKLLTPFTTFSFYKIMFGRAHAYRPYKRETFIGLDPQTGQTKEQVWHDGPTWVPLWPDDLILPAEDAQTIHDFSFCIRRYRVTPQQLLDGERKGLYFGIKENFAEILRTYKESRVRSNRGNDEMRVEMDEAQGVESGGSESSRNGIEVWEWYGRRRLPVDTDGDPDDDSIDRRSLDETELVVRYIEDLHLVIGCQDLAEQYPHMKDRRPFSEASLIKDGTYWGPSFPEMLERIENEATINHNLFTDAGRMMVGPLIFYKPGAGFQPKVMKYEPFMAIPTDDPNSVKVVSLSQGANLQYPIAKDQWITAIAERVTGRSDLNSGRAIDRPNSPKTATGTVALLEQGNIRASLDSLSMREDMAQIFKDLWLLDSYFAPNDLFFRVTEEDANGLFETQGGGAYLTTQERYGNYDFSIRLATSAWNKETIKQQKLALYQIDLQNPLIITNPRALWKLAANVHKAYGDDNFADIVPEPPDMGEPKQPREEWAMIQRGEDIEPHPYDDDNLHLKDHERRLAEQQGKPDRDENAVNLMIKHITAHEAQVLQKQVMAAAAQQMAAMMPAQGMPQVGAPEEGGEQPAQGGQQPPQDGGMLAGNPIQERVKNAMGPNSGV